MSGRIPGRFLFRAHGSNLYLDQDSRIVARLSTYDGNQASVCGYAFLNRPFGIGESLTLRIHAFQELSKSVFGFGMTSCNPDSLDIETLPDDCDLLFDRSEYWVMERAIFWDLKPGDELHFRFAEGANGDGEIQCIKNDLKPVSIMFVDKTIPLWPFFELGNIAELKLLDHSSYLMTSVNYTKTPNVDVSRLQIAESSPVKILPSPGRKPPAPPPPPRPISKKDQAPKTPALIPTALVTVTNGEKFPLKPVAANSKPVAKPAAVNHGVVQVIKPTAVKQTKNVAPPPPVSSGSRPAVNHSGKDSVDGRKRSTEGECVMCMEREIDCVLYTCGHMCLCYACATDLKNSAKSQCPVCRKDIADVIRTFRS